MPSLLFLSSAVAPSRLPFPPILSSPLTPSVALHSLAHGQKKEVRRRVRITSVDARQKQREVRRRAESERSEQGAAAVQDFRKDDGLADQSSKLPKTLNAPSRDSGGGERGSAEPLVQERVRDDLVRRYWLDELSGAVRIEEVSIDSTNESRETGTTVFNTEPVRLPFGIPLPKMVTDFVLPGGFPDTVSDDYLQYMLWQFPTNVTGWICSTIVTSSLFKAVGVGVDGGYAAAATATIKWVSKDGLGALGLVLIGGRFGSIFDEDPKQWRLYADFIGSAGGIFELCTPLAPDQFLLLGSLGYLLKAVAKGLKDPSFRVIQNHFAVAENVGDVSAKEEVWEVSAKLLGLLIAVILLGTPGLNSSYWKLVLVWASLRSFHLWLRYQSLSVVRFPTINYRRAALLVESHLGGYTVPGCKECNRRENLLALRQLMSPRIRLGCSFKDLLESPPSASEVEKLLALYCEEEYILVLHPNPLHGLEARVLVKEGATSTAMLRCMWQAHWLLLASVAKSRPPPVSQQRSSSSSLRGQVDKLAMSLKAVDTHFDSFLEELEGSGWNLDKIIVKVPNNAPVIMVS